MTRFPVKLREYIGHNVFQGEQGDLVVCAGSLRASQRTLFECDFNSAELIRIPNVQDEILKNV